MQGRKIDLKNWSRKAHFHYFGSMNMSAYGANVRMDVSKLVLHCKRTKESFFIHFLYVVTKELNKLESFRLRIIRKKPVLFDVIDPPYTVKVDDNFYCNVLSKMSDSVEEFYKCVKEEMEKAKTHKQLHASKADRRRLDVLYASCVPWLDFTSVSNPYINKPYSSFDSIPRAVWGKYTQTDDNFMLTLNISVSHALVDGELLSRAFGNIQQALNQY